MKHFNQISSLTQTTLMLNSIWNEWDSEDRTKHGHVSRASLVASSNQPVTTFPKYWTIPIPAAKIPCCLYCGYEMTNLYILEQSLLKTFILKETAVARTHLTKGLAAILSQSSKKCLCFFSSFYEGNLKNYRRCSGFVHRTLYFFVE